MRSLFVAGAHTDVGKTYVACALIAAARRQGRTVDALKPVVSGFDPDDWRDSDPGRLLAALGRAAAPEALETISPWRYRAPLAPPMAAAREDRALDLDEVADYCAACLEGASADLTIVEGVGGVMSPISETGTNLHLVKRLGIPAVLVGGSYLGAISHNLTAVAAMRAEGVTPLALVISQSAGTDAAMLLETVRATARLLTEMVAFPVITARRGATADWADEALAILWGS